MNIPNKKKRGNLDATMLISSFVLNSAMFLVSAVKISRICTVSSKIL